MRTRRRAQNTVSNHAPPDTFNSTNALESLHAAILCVETILHSASEAVDRLHSPRNPTERRAFARMQILVGKAAEEAKAALAHGDKLMAALTRHLQARQAKQEPDRRP